MFVSQGRPQEQPQIQDNSSKESLTSKPPPAPKIATRGKQLWTKSETLQLISQYASRSGKFKDPKVRNQEVWKEISEELGCGYTAQQCDGRWKTLVAGYKRVTDHNNKSGNETQKHEYEEELREALGDKRNINPTHILNSQDPQSFGIGQSSSSKRNYTRAQLLNETDEENPDADEAGTSKVRSIIDFKFRIS